MIQWVLGWWQMIGSGVSLIFRGPLFRKKLLHFLLASLYLLTLVLDKYIELPGHLVIWYLTIPPWSLAVYYYVLSYRRTYVLDRERGSFLPNLSF
jgi:hypothetical protein